MTEGVTIEINVHALTFMCGKRNLGEALEFAIGAGCEMYVTLEPCPMCSWAIIQSGIKTLYFGAYNPEYGILLSNPQYLPPPLANSKIKVYGGIEEDKCNKILEEFFKKIR